VGVTREDKEGLGHGLPRCFGIAAGGFDVGPAGSTKGVGLALVPHTRENVGSCCIAHVRQVLVGDSHVKPDLIEELVTGWLPLFSHRDLVDGQVEGSTWQNGGEGALSNKLISDSSCQVKDIHPRGARWLYSAKGTSQNSFSVPT